ncbi:MAG TPA: response regulator [Thermoanaerobaculia bacterium]|nr:response regulator [Thermoanaerobaculia bacterium]
MDDDEPIRALLFTILRRRGFRVDTACNGREGIDRIERCNYSLILLDLMMPVMSGYAFLDVLEKRDTALRPLVIVLTAGALPRNLNPNVVAGTVRKPFDIEFLVDTAAACLATLDAMAQVDSCPPPESERHAREKPN